MTSRPDHGEDSYKGSGRSLGQEGYHHRGGIGHAAAISFARKGEPGRA